ncbi:MAG: class I SAM-dependent methyltransferase [Dechloromonas sp.]|nr:MAG: class I SAM-dependent methyltransferase [Dechloromonas sp.]
MQLPESQTENYLKSVRDQYEALPYPDRNPEDEAKRLITTWLDDLPMINHYCFAGREAFASGFRILVAGGGTGDGTIYLAEQLRHTDAEIVHLDLSSASIDIARRRAGKRSLTNIRWVQDSILNIPQLGLGKFHYINCSGVLHHLADPDAGFQALRSALADNGALGIMVYGQYGRTGVYQMQSLLRAINQDGADSDQKIQRARDVMMSAPASNWYKCGRASVSLDHTGNAHEIYDLLLHSQDRAYTVPELYEWIVDRHGMNLLFTETERGGSVYVPQLVAGPHQLEYLTAASRLPVRQQQEIAELLGGSISRHSFYVTQQAGSEAPYGDADLVPLLIHEAITGPQLAEFIDREQQKGRLVTINHIHTGITARLDPGRYAKYILNNIDGRRTFGEIFDIIRGIAKFKKAPPSDQELFADFREMYDFLRAIERLLLRHRSVPAQG